MNESRKILIDRNACTGCKLCIADCPSHILILQDQKATVSSDRCLKCGHCIAVCPVNAVAIQGYDMNEVIPFDPANFTLNEDTFLNAIKFRRSVRQFINRKVEPHKLEKIIEAGRFTPTGTNSQNVRYVVVEQDIARMEKAALQVAKRLQWLAVAISKVIKLPYDLSKYELKEGFFFHKAPALILTISKDDLNAALASMSMELMAEAMGLGTLYVRLFTEVANRNKTIKKMIGLAKREKVVMCLALGYPAVHYLRTVPRNKARIEWK